MMNRKLDWIRVHGKRAIAGKGIGGALGLGLIFALLLASPAALAALDLGPAAGFAVFQMGTTTSGGTMSTSGNVTINGDVGFRAASASGNASTIVNGNVEGPNPSPPGWTINGTYTQVPDSTLMDIANQARAFSAAAVAEGAGLQNIGNVSGNTTYTFTAANLAEPGTFIVNANNISLFTGNLFTLNGTDLPAGSRVIVNVASGLSLGGGSIVLQGLTSAQVLINFTGTSTSIGTGSSIAGTVLMPNATASLNGTGVVLQGSLIAQSMFLSFGPTINGIPFIPEPSTCIASALLLLPFGASALRIARKR